EAKHPSLSFPSYIDDVAIVTSSPSLEENARELAKAAQTACTWASQNAVAVDDPKSELMHFHRMQDKEKADRATVILPNGFEVKPKSSIRWLGMWLDPKLQWKEHVRTKYASAERVLHAIRRLSNTERGLPATAMRQLYQSCVVPILDYGVEVWWNGQV